MCSPSGGRRSAAAPLPAVCDRPPHVVQGDSGHQQRDAEVPSVPLPGHEKKNSSLFQLLGITGDPELQQPELLTCCNLRVVSCLCPGSSCRRRPSLHCPGSDAALRQTNTRLVVFEEFVDNAKVGFKKSESPHLVRHAPSGLLPSAVTRRNCLFPAENMKHYVTTGFTTNIEFIPLKGTHLKLCLFKSTELL